MRNIARPGSASIGGSRSSGATRLSPRVDCDTDYDEPAAAWAETVVAELAADLGAPAASFRAVTLRVHMSTALAYDKRNPFPATMLENIRIVSRHSTKETRHVELDLSGSGLTYQPGDALGFAPRNDPAVVEQLLEATGLAGDLEVSVKGQSVPLAAALTSRFEITGPSPRFIEQWAKLSDAAELKALAAPEASADRFDFLERHHIVDIAGGSRSPAWTRRACSPDCARCSRGSTRSHRARPRSATRRI